MTGIIFWIVFGLIVGLIAKYLVPGEAPGGIIGDIIVGIVGGVIGGWIFYLIGHAGETGFSLPSVVCAVIGAVVLLYIIRVLSGRRTAA